MSTAVKKAGFVQSLFNGYIDKDLFRPFPVYGKEEREEMFAIIDMVKRFANESIDPVKIDREHHIPDSVKDGMKELGLWGLIIPEEYGGFGQPEVTYYKALDALSAVCASTSIMYGGHLSIGLKAILLFGTEEQKQKFLPGLSAGEQIAGFALTEPGAGSDAAGVKTAAVLSDDGTYYTLNGRKQWITNGGFADVFTVFAKIQKPGEEPDSSQITGFIVTRDMEGFSSGKEEDKLGICGSSTTPLYMDNMKVPAENILGEIGGGFKIAMEVLNTGRLGLAASFVGAAKALTPHAIKFVIQREQFRKKISEFEIIKEKFSRIMISTFTGESMVYYATYLEDLPGASFAVEAAICKAFTSETLWQTINDCLQAAGGNGFMKEYPYERFLRDARINLIFEGTNEILRMFIAVSGIRMLSVKLKKYQKGLSGNPDEREKQIDDIYKELYLNEDSYKLEEFSDKLNNLISTAGSLAQKLNETAVKAVLRNGRDIKDKQYIQRRLADAAMDIFGMFANIARVENLIRKNHNSVDDALLVSEMFAYQAESRVVQNLNEVSSNRDESLTKLAQMLFDSEKYPFEILDY